MDGPQSTAQGRRALTEAQPMKFLGLSSFSVEQALFGLFMMSAFGSKADMCSATTAIAIGQ